MTTAARIKVDVTTNAGKAKSELGGLDGQLQKTKGTANQTSSGFNKLGAAAGVAAGIIAVKLVGAVKDFVSESIALASAAEETQNKFNVTFGTIRKEAQETADNLAKNFGLAGFEAQKLLSDTGDLLTGFGFTQKASLDLSSELNTLAVDLASFTNIEGGAQRASKALTSALFGEREAAKQLGIVIREDDIMQRLAAKGMKGLTGQALLQAKAQETLLIATEQSKNAIGDFARSSMSYANQQKIINSRLADFKVKLGAQILPAMKAFQGELLNATGDSGKLAEAFGTFIRKAMLVIPIAVKEIQLFSLRIDQAFFEVLQSAGKFTAKLGKAIGSQAMQKAGAGLYGFGTEQLNQNLKEQVDHTKSLYNLKKAWYATEEEIAAAHNEVMAEGDKKAAENRLTLEEKLQKQIEVWRNKASTRYAQYSAEIIGNTAAMLTDLQTVFTNFGAKNHDLAVSMKVVSMAQAAINSYLAYTKALASFPPPFNYIAAGTTLAAGLAKQAAIASTPIPAQFGGSFMVPPGNQADSGLLRVNQGEQVDVTPVRESGSSMPKSMTLMIGNKAFEAYVIQTAEKGFNSGRAQIRRPGAVKI